MRPDATPATLRRIVKKLDKNRDDLTERLIGLTTTMQAHVEADAVAFRVLGESIVEINKDVKSLLASRSFLRGTWFAIVIACTFVAAVAGLVVAWYK